MGDGRAAPTEEQGGIEGPPNGPGDPAPFLKAATIHAGQIGPLFNEETQDYFADSSRMQEAAFAETCVERFIDYEVDPQPAELAATRVTR